ncbi:Ras-related GTP-binding protein A [Smittium culicis]|uniref:GTP-binding protein n=1 Tax=Smittium culicis TaxID=133412 RepID=A0A1R1YCT5_9FUNG|nr:Ras-related GTP-binding protein A [Smittium culicis]
MGKSGAGKTSMRAMIFSNYGAVDTRRLGATMEIEHSTVPFIADLQLNIWDCGGQTRFMDNYVNEQRYHVFRDAEVLIYVFDIESRDQSSEFVYYQEIINCLASCSPNAKILTNYKESLEPLTHPFKPVFYATTIWNFTLYRAWSDIANKLVPNIGLIESQLQKFGTLCGASQVVMFEKSTFLVISYIQENSDLESNHEKFVQVSETIKSYRVACKKRLTHFVSVRIRNGPFSMFIEPFTSTTYILVVVNDPDVGKITF